MFMVLIMRNDKARVPDPNDFVSCPGDLFEVQYSSKVMPDGTIKLEPSGKIDIKAMINSQKESTDIAYIIKQLENGNTDVINPGPLFYGDSTVFPKTYAECLQLRIDAENSFYQLPVDVRARFDNDFNQYFSQAGSPEWMSKLGFDEQSDQKKNDEVISDES